MTAASVRSTPQHRPILGMGFMLCALAMLPGMDAIAKHLSATLPTVEVTWGRLADHVILTPGVVTEEMVNAAVAMTGKGGKVTITAVGHVNEHAVHVHAGQLHRRRVPVSTSTHRVT